MLAPLRENLTYKLLALGFAIALHFYVVGQENPVQTRTLLVPLTVRGLPPDLIFDEKNAPQISVTLSGPTDLLKDLPAADVTAAIDVSRDRAGRNVPKAVQVLLPPSETGISVEAQPRVVAVTLQAKEKRSVAITASDPGTPPAGYRFRPARITPRYALIEGSQEMVDQVRQVAVNVDAGDTVGTIDNDFPVVALDSQGAQVSGVTVLPTSAHVRITMGKVPAAKTLIVSANLTGSLPYPGRVSGIDITPQTLTVTGRPEALSQAYTVQTAPIDLSGITADVTRQVPCLPPPGLVITGPAQVTVTVHVTSQAPPAVTPPAVAPPAVVTPNETPPP